MTLTCQHHCFLSSATSHPHSDGDRLGSCFQLGTTQCLFCHWGQVIIELVFSKCGKVSHCGKCVLQWHKSSQLVCIILIEKSIYFQRHYFEYTIINVHAKHQHLVMCAFHLLVIYGQCISTYPSSLLRYANLIWLCISGLALDRLFLQVKGK